MHCRLIIFFFSCSYLSVVAQPADNLSSYFSEIRSGKSTALYKILKKYSKKDIDVSVQDSLLSFLDRRYPHLEHLIRIIGFTGPQKSIIKLKDFITPHNSPTIRWSALLALSRLGDADAIHDVMHRARKLEVNDAVVNNLFPDLIYTRQRQAIDYVIEILMSDKLSCESVNNDSPSAIPCGYRIMEQLAPVIKNYPLALDGSGDIKTNDYKKSLGIVRHWFRKNRNYIIDDSKF